MEELSSAEILRVLHSADEMADALAMRASNTVDADKLVALLLFEPGSTNSAQFQAACFRLGAGLMTPQEDSDQLAANPDALQTYLELLAEYVNLVVLPLDHPNVATVARRVRETPLLNGGCENGNPLEVLYGIFKILGRLDDLRIAVEFHAAGFRAAEAFALTLSKFPANHFTFLCGDKGPSDSFLSKLQSANARTEVLGGADQLSDIDVIYVDKNRSILSSAVSEKTLVVGPGIEIMYGFDADRLKVELAKVSVPLRMAMLHYCLQRES